MWLLGCLTQFRSRWMCKTLNSLRKASLEIAAGAINAAGEALALEKSPPGTKRVKAVLVP